MATSTLIVDYLGVGLAVALPVAPNVPSTGSAFYYETDTPALRVWNGSAWVVVATGVAAGTVTHTGGALTLHAPIVGAGTNDEKALAAMTDGQLMIGHTGADPALATLTAGAGGINIANGAGGIVISINSTGVIHTSGDLTANAIVVGGGTNDIEVIGPLTNGQLIIGNTGNPATLTTLTAGTGITVTNAPGSITLSLPDTAVTPGAYGDDTHVATFTVDAKGRLTAAASTAISFPAAGTGTVTHTAGALTLHAPIVGAGSADEKALAAMTDGQLMIGSTGADPALATLTAGSNVTITNAGGSITIAASAPGTGTVTHTGGALTLHAPIVGAGTDDAKALAAMTDGQLMIGSTGVDPALATLTAGANITITNAGGSITIAASAGGTSTLAGATDANISSPANKDLLEYKTSDNKWHNTTLTAYLDDVFGATQGAMLYRNGTVWTELAPGTAGQTLRTLGSGANPQWASSIAGVDALGNTITLGTAVDCATTASVFSGYTYSNGTAGVGATLTAAGNGAVTIDGFALNTLNQRVLSKNEKSLTNGVYKVTTVGDSTHTLVLTRVTDFDQAAEMLAGSAFFILNGTVNAGTVWSLSYTITTVGTDVLSFNQVTGSVAGASGGGSRGMYQEVMSAAVPTQFGTGFTSWLNQPTGATVTDAATGIAVFSPSQSANNRIAAVKLDVSGLTRPYTKKGLFAYTCFPSPAGQSQMMAGFSDGTKLVVFQITMGIFGGANIGIEVYEYSTVLIAASTNRYQKAAQQIWMAPFWVSLTDDNTNIKFGISQDGVNYLTLYSQLRTSFLANDNYIVFGTNSYNEDATTTLMSWA